jgi:hypothetical protein
MLIAEEFLLLCLDDVSGKKSIAGEKIDPALGGALLVELALAERIGVTPPSDGWSKRGRITITSTKPTDDDVLDDAMAYLVAKEGKKAKDVISPMAFRPMTKGLRERLLQRLARAGVLTQERGTVLGFIPTTSWPTADAGVEQEIRARLRSALVDGLTPAERTVALIALLTVTGHLKKALPGEDQKLVKQRAKALTEGDWAAKAVKQALDELHAAMAASAAGGASGGGS